MSLPTNFSSPPSEEPHRYFRNLCIEFRKLVLHSKDSLTLQQEMEKFLNASKEMTWERHNTGVYHKDEGEKAAQKVWVEFKRYIDNHLNSSQDLLEAISAVEQLINSLKVR